MLEERKMVKEVSPQNDGKEILVAGFVKKIHSVGKQLKFVILEDQSGDAQITFKKEYVGDKILEEVGRLTPQSVICVKGFVQKSNYCKRGVELIAKDMQILSKSHTPLPLDMSGKVGSHLSTRLNWRFLDLRNRKKRLIFYLLSDFVRYSREFFYESGFIEIFTPKLMGAPSESGAEVFEVRYFGKKAYLAQSPQFYKQMAISAGFEKVFEIAPVFRANPSFTRRHDTEFTSLDIEMAYIDSFEDLMKFEESWLTYVLKKLKEKYDPLVKQEFNIEIEVPTTPFPRLKMREVYRILEKEGMEIEEGSDIGTVGERMIGEYVKKKFGHDFVFITHFPWEIRPFYHMRDKDPSLTLSYDLLWKGLEVTTGAQREHRYEILVEQAKEKGLNLENIQFYLNFFKYGCPPHGGFGLSPTRCIMCLLNLENVREATLLPRDPERLYP